MKRKGAETLPQKKVKESSDELPPSLHINSLPEDVFIKIFSYMKQNDLSRISRVCKKWNAYARSSVLWKKVDVMFRTHYRHKYKATKYIVEKFPSCLTHIKLDFRNNNNWSEPFNFNEFSSSLQKCPHLQTLVLNHAQLSITLPSVIDLCNHFLWNLRTLVLRYTSFENDFAGSCDCISKIEILDVSGCELRYYNKPPFSRMPYLKQLYLAHSIGLISWFETGADFLTQLEVLDVGHTDINSRIFRMIRRHGHNLKEIYITSIHLPDFKFNRSRLPRLETISLKNCLMSCEGIISLIRSCQSLHQIYVNKITEEELAEHPDVLENKDLLKNLIITDISVNKRDYLYD